MYKKVSGDLNFVKREEEVLRFWQEREINKKVHTLNPDGEVFTVYDGPPTANGKPHIGHILTRAVKDIFPRFQRMKGKNVEFIAGWDTHGLPVELEVEKALGINGKEELEAYGVEPFIEQCKESVWTYKDEWEQISDRVGFTADMEHPYVTYDNDYIESEWWALKQMWDKDLLYKGYKVVPYCPRCGTSLSSHEVAQGYKDVTDTSAYVRFRVKDETDTYFAAWTTTPWTLPSNIALCVNPSSRYALIEVDEPVHVCAGHCDHDHDTGTAEGAVETVVVRYYIAEELARGLFGEDIRVLRTMPGADLEGMSYEPLLPYATELVDASGKKAFVVTRDDYVTMSEGTGIVHIAPAFGEDDARIGRAYDLAFVQLVEDDGTMPAEVSDFAGQFVKDADKGILQKLSDDGLLIRTMEFEHSYPFCWRCDTSLIYYARHSWFIRMTAVKENLIANNRSVNWYPEHIREGRMGNFLENVIDWGLSRERYWGTPLPVWECDDCDHRHLIGSIEELKSMSDDCPDDIELHKPYIDAVHIRCEKCGGVMTRVPEVIDCWFDSGSMPFAQYHYPFENKELFEQNFPADFISEALDQTRGWFYSLIAISTCLFEQPSYKNCIVMGLVQDKEGQKMSKHKGNVVDPWQALNKQGADAVRWYFYTNSQPWLPSRFSDEAVDEGQRKFMGTLWNTYAFYIMYAGLDGFDPTKHELDYETLSVMDRWLLARLDTLVEEVDKGLTSYDIYSSGKKIDLFVDELSNWYVRRGRSRYWQSGMEQDKINAYMTLYTALTAVIKVAAPFVPFITEAMYQNLVRSVDPQACESVHLCTWPETHPEWRDKQLEADMGDVLSIVVLGRAARNVSAVKNRQPLAKIYVKADKILNAELNDVIKDELNVRDLVNLDDDAELQDYRFKPQLRLLGKLLGKNLPAVSAALGELDGRVTKNQLDADGFIEVRANGETYRLTGEQLIIESAQAEGLASQSNAKFTVALDLRLTPELIEEGFVREVISKVQNMRKDSGFEVSDRIILTFKGSATIEDVIRQNKDEIAKEVLATEVLCEDLTEGEGKQWNLNGEPCTLRVEVVK
ncbi:MAG: isoleucine--tRNA ligase [Fastidiosipilaceae bacterium]|jgi:isoleucyl-tRNA synthetase